jgi:S-adenosylmethionine decarboxylase
MRLLLFYKKDFVSLEMSLKYSPGLHIIWDMHSAKTESLMHANGFCSLIHALIKAHGLTQTGEVLHVFDGGGYTVVVGLTESHLSVHTWPEFGKVSFDLFLSNFIQVNNGIVESISDAVISFFGGTLEKVHRLER